MKVRVVKRTDRELEVEIEGEGHTFLNLLVDELNRMEKVDFAAYAIDHPDFPVARLRVASRDAAPEDVIGEACKRISARAKLLQENFREAIREVQP